MNEKKVPLRLVPTGIPGLDEVLGGGLPEYSLTLIAGSPGVGKTTLIHQLAFANATVERPALYFTVMGEPPLKMLRYQQQMEFFDSAKVGNAVRFVDLSKEALAGDLDQMLETIVQTVQDSNPAIVIVDSFRSVVRGVAETQLELQTFLQRLALHLASWETTSFLLGEYGEGELHNNALFTVADGIIWLSQTRDRNSVIRKMEIMKLRGLPSMAGLHTFRISSKGLSVFPRGPAFDGAKRVVSDARLEFGVPGLDQMLGGGAPEGDATLVAGPSGTGKTLLGTHFAAEAARKGERAVLAIFEEHPSDYLARAKNMGFDLQTMEDQGHLKILYMRPLDLSADEVLERTQQAVIETGAKRLVLDSLNGLELALAPDFRDEFRESLYRMTGRLTGRGVSILFTMEVMERFTDISFSHQSVSFLAQNILYMRYVEIEGRLRRMLAVIKMRRSQHSPELREYTITSAGMRVLSSLSGYQGLLTGVPTAGPGTKATIAPGLIPQEQMVLEQLRATPKVSEAALAQDLGTEAEIVRRALARLTELEYATTERLDGAVVYRATGPTAD